MKLLAFLPLVVVVSTVACDEARRAWSEPTAVAVPPGSSGAAIEEEHVTTRLRRELLADETLSVTARAVSITTREGAVTLHGLVLSQDERVRITSHARGLPGVRTVYDRLEVASH